MKGTSFLNGVWLVLVLCAVVATMGVGRTDATSNVGKLRPELAASGRFVATKHGEPGLADASGVIVPIRPYRRIASSSTVADGLLLALAEPDRIAALTRYGFQNHPQPFLWSGRAQINGPADLEKLLALHVDLLVGNFYASPDVLARAREAGIQVFHLGEMRGLTTYLPNAEALAALLGERARGTRYAETFRQRMQAVAADVPQGERKTALYFSAHAGQLFGAGERSSFHDVLTHAGLIDLAVGHVYDFPQLDPEQVLALDPDVIVTHLESRPLVCRINGLDALRACRDPERDVLGVKGALMSDPGAGMLDAAEQLRALAYGPRPYRAKGQEHVRPQGVSVR